MNRWTLFATVTFAVVFTGSYVLFSHENSETDDDEMNLDLLEVQEEGFDQQTNVTSPGNPADAAIPTEAVAPVLEDAVVLPKGMVRDDDESEAPIGTTTFSAKSLKPKVPTEENPNTKNSSTTSPATTE
jgi:hypothetical protein